MPGFTGPTIILAMLLIMAILIPTMIRKRKGNEPLVKKEIRTKRSGAYKAVGIILLFLVGSFLYLNTPILWGTRVPEATVISSPFEDEETERIIVLSPHPDDDVLAAGGMMAEAASEGQSILVVYLTNGDGNRASKRFITLNPFHNAAEYRALGQRRQKEAIRALSVLEIDPQYAVFLGYPDKGLWDMWTEYWTRDQVYRSPFTNATNSFYRNSFNPDAVYCGEDLLEDLLCIISLFRPTIVYIPHPRDVHPDHKAAAHFASAAVIAATTRDPEFSLPEMYHYIVHAHELVWPWPRRLHPEKAMEIPAGYVDEGQWVSLQLSPRLVELKHKAIKAHASQNFTSGRFLASFVRSNELFVILADSDQDVGQPP